MEPQPEPGGRGGDVSLLTPVDRRCGVCLLGGFELCIGAGQIDPPRAVQRVVALIACSDRPVAREAVLGTLWPDLAEQRAGHDLRTVLWRLHRSFEGLVHITRSDLRLAPGVTTDVQELLEVSARLRDGTVPARYQLEVLSAGPLLPGWYDGWVLLERERLTLVRIQALENLAETRAAQGRFREAEAAALAAVEAEPLRESAQRLLVAASIAQGNRAEAIRRYARYRQLLAQELGVGPTFDLADIQRDAPRP